MGAPRVPIIRVSRWEETALSCLVILGLNAVFRMSPDGAPPLFPLWDAALPLNGHVNSMACR